MFHISYFDLSKTFYNGYFWYITCFELFTNFYLFQLLLVSMEISLSKMPNLLLTLQLMAGAEKSELMALHTKLIPIVKKERRSQ